MRLQVGQIIRYGPTLWRVDYVNECRARIVPLNKQLAVPDAVDDVETERKHRVTAERYGVNISANSIVTVVTDLERAKAELELAEAEREVKTWRNELAQRDADEDELAIAERELEALRRKALHEHIDNALTVPKATRLADGSVPRTAPAGKGWYLIDGQWPETKPGSLKAQVLAYLKASPGRAAKDITIAGFTAGAIAACLDRFMKSGVLIRK